MSLLLRYGILALTVAVASSGRSSAQEVIRLVGQPFSVTPEFEEEHRPIAFGAEKPAAMFWSAAGPTRVLCLAYSPDGSTLAVGDGPSHPVCTLGGPPPINENGGLIRLIDTATNRVRLTLKPTKLPDHEYHVRFLMFTEGGKTLLSLVCEASRADDARRPTFVSNLTVWDATTGEPRNILVDDDEPWSRRVVSQDGKYLARALKDGTVRVVDTATGRHVTSLGQPVEAAAGYKSMEFSPDHRTLAVGHASGELVLWNVANGERLARFPGHQRDGENYAIQRMAYSPDGRLLASEGSFLRVGPDQSRAYTELRFFDVPGHKELAVRPLPDGQMVYCMRFSPDGRTLATGGPEGIVRLWDTARWAERASLRKHDSWLLEFAFSADGKLLAAGDRRSITLWDVATAKERAYLQPHDADITGIEFSPDGRTLASAGGDLKLWDLRATVEPRPDEGHIYGVSSVAYAPDGRTLASGSEDMTVKLWDLANRKPRATLRGHSDEVTCIAFARGGKVLASGSHDRTVRLWDPNATVERTTLRGHSVPVLAVAFSPDGRVLASGGGSGEQSGEVKLWDVLSGRMAATVLEHTCMVNALAFSPDGATLAIGRDDDTVVLWDVASGRMRETLPAAPEGTHSKGILCLAFSPDGKRLAAGCRDKTVRLWSLALDGRRQARSLKHEEFVVALAFSPDGERLATAARDRTVKVWGVVAGEELARFASDSDDWFTSVAFSPEGTKLAAGHRDSHIRIWRVDQIGSGR